MKKNFILFPILLLCLNTSCASNGFLMAKPQVTMFGQPYPAKSQNEKVDVYLTNKPTQEYIEFAKITCEDTDDKWSLEQISKKAREIGADGIIIIGNTGSTGVGVPIGNSAYVVNSNYGMAVIAIKYK